MSSYYTIACHTCEEKMDMAGYTDEYVVKMMGEWAKYHHFAHSVCIVSDMNGWDEDFDELCDKVDKYKKVDINL